MASFYVGCNLPNNLSSPGLRCLCGDYDLVKTVANQIVENDNELCTLLGCLASVLLASFSSEVK